MSEGMSRYVCVPNFKSILLKMTFLGRFKCRKWPLFLIFLCITKPFCFFSLSTFLPAPNVVLRSFFELWAIQQPKNIYHEVKWPKSQGWPRDYDGLDLTQGHKKLKMMHLSVRCSLHVDSCADYASAIDKTRSFGKPLKFSTFCLWPDPDVIGDLEAKFRIAVY